jgi:hypothetical protein
LWTKRAVIVDLLISLQTALSGVNIISAITLVRPILEHVAAVSIAAHEILSLFDKTDLATKDKSDKIIRLCEIISKRGKGTRVDWETYLTKSLRTGKKKSYKAEPGTVDLTALDLMNSIDHLDKKIKGARKAYEFASEFAHPNVGSHFIYAKSASYATLSDGIRIWDRISCRDCPENGIGELRERLIEMLQISLESIEVLKENVKNLENTRKIVIKWTKEVVRNGISNHPLIFNLKEPCPCFSGMEFGSCCGKKVKAIHRRMLV